MGNVPWARDIRTGSSSHGLYMLYFTRCFDTVTHIDQRGKFVHSGSQCPNVYVLPGLAGVLRKSSPELCVNNGKHSESPRT